MTVEAWSTVLGTISLALSALSLAVGLVVLGYLLRVWEEGRERR